MSKIDVYLGKSVTRTIVPITDLLTQGTVKLPLSPEELLEYMAARTVVEKYQRRFKYKRKTGYDNPYA